MEKKQDRNFGVDVTKSEPAKRVLKLYEDLASPIELMVFWAQNIAVKNNSGKGKSLVYVHYTHRDKTVTLSRDGGIMPLVFKATDMKTGKLGGVCGQLGLLPSDIDYLVALGNKTGYDLWPITKGKAYYSKKALQALPEDCQETETVTQSFTGRELSSMFKAAQTKLATK